MVSERPFRLFFHYFVLPLCYQNSTGMARQAEASTSYKVKIHLNNGYTLDVAIKRQRAALEEIMAGGLSMEDDRTLISYALNTKKVEEVRLASGFL